VSRQANGWIAGLQEFVANCLIKQALANTCRSQDPCLDDLSPKLVFVTQVRHNTFDKQKFHLARDTGQTNYTLIALFHDKTGRGPNWILDNNRVVRHICLPSIVLGHLHPKPGEPFSYFIQEVLVKSQSAMSRRQLPAGSYHQLLPKPPQVITIAPSHAIELHRRCALHCLRS
jgi:hypothetical protein